MSNTLTTQQVADRLGVTTVRVRALITAGRLPAEKFGRDYVIREVDLKLVAHRQTGRPPKHAQPATGNSRRAQQRKVVRSDQR